MNKVESSIIKLVYNVEENRLTIDENFKDITEFRHCTFILDNPKEYEENKPKIIPLVKIGGSKEKSFYNCVFLTYQKGSFNKPAVRFSNVKLNHCVFANYRKIQFEYSELVNCTLLGQVTMFFNSRGYLSSFSGIHNAVVRNSIFDRCRIDILTNTYICSNTRFKFMDFYKTSMINLTCKEVNFENCLWLKNEIVGEQTNDNIYGYALLKSKNNKPLIATLTIPKDAKYSHDQWLICKADKAKVVSIQDFDEKTFYDIGEVVFEIPQKEKIFYRIGEELVDNNYSEKQPENIDQLKRIYFFQKKHHVKIFYNKIKTKEDQ